MTDSLPDVVGPALSAAPPFVRPGLWTPLTYTAVDRADSAYTIAAAIRLNAHRLTAEERSLLAAELLNHHSCDHAHERTS